MTFGDIAVTVAAALSQSTIPAATALPAICAAKYGTTSRIGNAPRTHAPTVTAGL